MLLLIFVIFLHHLSSFYDLISIIYYVCDYAVGMKSSVWWLIGILWHFLLLFIHHLSSIYDLLFIIYYVCGYAVGMKSSVWGLIGILLHSAQSARPFFLMHILHMSHQSSVWNKRTKTKINKTSGEKRWEYLSLFKKRISQDLNDIHVCWHTLSDCSRWACLVDCPSYTTEF